MSEEESKTLFVGNLDPSITKELIVTIFSGFGQVLKCHMINEMAPANYCFVEMDTRDNATVALSAMHRRMCCGKELKVNWATPSKDRPVDTSSHYHIFVGDLGIDVDNEILKGAFLPFGEISDCRVVRDPTTQLSKGYGFISFVHKADAEAAIAEMNGVVLAGRVIRTNWATRKAAPASPASREHVSLNYHDVFFQTGAFNTTVYCRTDCKDLTEDLVANLFSPFGKIEDIRMFKQKGYFFVKHDTKEAAALAIVNLHNTEFNGCRLKCSWGKEPSEPMASTDGLLDFPSASFPPVGPRVMNCYPPPMYSRMGYPPYGS